MWDEGQRYPTQQEKKAAAPEETRKSPAKKDRKRWCGGHRGREHQIVVALPPNLAGWVTEKRRKTGHGPCRKAAEWYLKTRAFQRFRMEWWCQHERLCTVCGRQFGLIPWQECPDRLVDDE